MSQSILMEKTIPKQYNRNISNSNDKKMSKESKSRFDFFWTDDEIHTVFFHLLSNSNFCCYCSRSALSISCPFEGYSMHEKIK